MRVVDGAALLAGGLLVIFAPVLGSLVSSRWRCKVIPAGAQREKAHAQFAAWLGGSGAASLGLAPDRAEPVLETENIVQGEYGGAAHYSLTWYLRNAEGQYVMLLSTQAEQPFVKLLEDRYARAVLKARYQPPA